MLRRTHIYTFNSRLISQELFIFVPSQHLLVLSHIQGHFYTSTSSMVSGSSINPSVDYFEISYSKSKLDELEKIYNNIIYLAMRCY